MPRRGGTLTPSQPPVDRDPDTVHVIVIPLSQDQSQSTTHRPGSWCLGLSNIPDIYLKFRQRSLMIVPILVFLDVALKDLKWRLLLHMRHCFNPCFLDVALKEGYI